MAYFQQLPGFSPTHLATAPCWEHIFASSQDALLVDVGGSKGDFSISLARQFPMLRCIVQDTPETIALTNTPADLDQRVSFMAHNLLSPQPVRDADVFFFRSVFHNWPDPYCVNILQALIPALKPGVRVILNEFCLPPQAGLIPAFGEQALRSFDLAMLGMLNAKERELDEWKLLFQQADPRYQFKEVHRLAQSPLVLIEAVWAEPAAAT